MSRLARLRNIVLVAVVTAAFIGPGTVTTCTLAGAKLPGYALLWGLLFSTVATVLLQEMSAFGWESSVKRAWARPSASRPKAGPRLTAVVLVLSAIVIGNAAFQTGNILGGGMGLETIVGRMSFPLGSLIERVVPDHGGGCFRASLVGKLQDHRTGSCQPRRSDERRFSGDRDHGQTGLGTVIQRFDRSRDSQRFAIDARRADRNDGCAL